jgi:hypothetical protein
VRTNNAFVTLTDDSREVSGKALLSLFNDIQQADGPERHTDCQQDAGGSGVEKS